MKVLIVISAPHLWNVEKRCIKSVMNQDALDIDVVIGTNRGEAESSLKLEPKHLNRVTQPVRHSYDYFFPMQSDIILPQNALTLILLEANVDREAIILALCSPRKSTLEEADREEGEPNHIRELGHYQCTMLNGRILLDNIDRIKEGKPFTSKERFYFGWNCCLIPSKILREHPFTEDRSYDVSWSDEIQKAGIPIIIDPRVKVGHIDRDGKVYYGF